MIEGIRLVAFDADDTLWSSEPLFRNAERRVAEMLSAFGDFEYISDELYKTESRNMPDLGFGAKPYIISMIETAARISGSLTAEQIDGIVDSGREILRNPATPLPGVEETLQTLCDDGRYRLAMLTKGDLLEQERKVERSGLGKYFGHIEIVSDKNARVYSSLCDRLGYAPEEMLMVGNSFKSDIDPVLKLGGWGIHIPFEVLWKLEHIEEYDHPRLLRLSSITQLPAVLL